MRTICLTLAYDGAAYCGWQVQARGRTLQQTVEEALAAFTGESIRVTAAGRTDAGVHALGQLVTFETAGVIPAEGFRWGLQMHLPEDIVVRDAAERPRGFSARYDAVRKRYRYVIENSRIASPWLRKYVWHHRRPIGYDVLQAAADVVVGTHDFRCFESKWPNTATSVRTIFEARWWRTDIWTPWGGAAPDASVGRPGAAAGPFLCLDLVGDGFLYNMARAIVGTLVHVGRGRWTPDDVRRILETGDRRHAGDTAPPQGLYLIEVETVVDPERIAARLQRFRARAAAAAEEDID